MSAITGWAMRAGTERFRQRFASLDPSHFRSLQDLWVSSIGLGTYLGDADDATDGAYQDALRTAMANGCNVIDSAINYRCQRSERTIGRALAAAIADKTIARDEVLLCTKGGYVPYDGSVPDDPARYLIDVIINTGVAAYDDLVAGCHCLSPSFLAESLDTSLANLGVSTIDVYYLHNPEQQLDEIDRDTFMQRLEAAFAWLEQRVADGQIRWYGSATWNGFRVQSRAKEYLSLEALVQLAERVGGSQHHFRMIQLPYNLSMPEASSFKNQTVDGESVTVLEAATRLGLSVLCSASLLQSRLTRLPQSLGAQIPGCASDAQRAIQFVRSTPGVTTALIGMKQSAHAQEILVLAKLPVLDEAHIHHLFDRTRR